MCCSASSTMRTEINEDGDDCCIEIPALPESQSDYFIFRVHSQLQIANEKCYEPEIIAIGPYYHDRREKMKLMEEQKLHYLQSFLKRTGESVERYIDEIKSLEGEARKYYAELPKLNSKQFTKIMLLDGCFIIELFCKVDNSSLIDHRDPIFQMNWLKNALERDLLLFENQIPFFVLEKLYEMSHHKGENMNKGLTELAMNFFHPLLPGNGLFGKPRDDIKSLVGLIYHNWLPGVAKNSDNDQNSWNLIQCASKLVESGVKFKKASNESCLFDITFKNGTMEIPCISIENRTECFLRNLIAYEEYYQNIQKSHIIFYLKFLDCLIQSAKDVEILRQHGIITNWIGDDEAVSKIFNKINHRVTAPSEHFQYSDIFNEVNAYYKKKRNRWMAKLKRRYLDSPWAIISIFVGFALLVLSLIQSIFSVLTYRYRH